MVNNDHTKQYSAADIQRYLQGNMLPADMHALEQAALDDPFLADAIEGMQQTLETRDAGLINTDLEDLSGRVQERIKRDDRKTRVIAFRWWQVAAAAAIVVVAGIGIYRYSGSPKTESLSAKQIAEVKPPVQAQDVATTPSAPAAKEEEKALAPVADAKTQANASEGLVTVTPAKAARNKRKRLTYNKITLDSNSLGAVYKLSEANSYSYNTSDSYANTATRPLSVTSNTIKFDSADLPRYRSLSKSTPAFTANKPADYEQIVIPKTKRDSLAKDYYSKPRADLAMNPSKKELSELSDKQLSRELKKNPNALLSGYIKGRVADQNNTPLYNVVVRVDNNRDFFTDKQGFFNIPASDSVVKVAVGYNGYYTQNLQLQNNTRNNQITLNQLGFKQPNPQLNTAPLAIKKDTLTFEDGKAKSNAAFGRLNTAEAFVNAITQDAQPEYGWLEYHQYLDKNKKIETDQVLTGKVIVSFQVDKKGLLSDFKIEQSLSKVYDDEAIRLIKAGPSWKLTKGRKARATVVVNF